jgi:hypothetical protein
VHRVFVFLVVSVLLFLLLMGAMAVLILLIAQIERLREEWRGADKGNEYFKRVANQKQETRS